MNYATILANDNENKTEEIFVFRRFFLKYLNNLKWEQQKSEDFSEEEKVYRHGMGRTLNNYLE